MTKSHHPPSPKTRKPTVLALSLILAATCLAARSADSPKALVMLRAVETQPAADGSGTRITFHGSHPLSYSLSPVEGRSWSLTMNGVDCRDVPKEIAPGTAQVSRVRIHPVVGTKGRSATRVDFELPGESDRERLRELATTCERVRFGDRQESSSALAAAIARGRELLAALQAPARERQEAGPAHG